MHAHSICYFLCTLAWMNVAPRHSGGLNVEIVVKNRLNLVAMKYILKKLSFEDIHLAGQK